MFKKKKRIEKIEEKIKAIKQLNEEMRVSIKQLACPHTRTELVWTPPSIWDEGPEVREEVCVDCGKSLRRLNEKEYYLAKKEKAGQRINEAKKEIQEIERKIKEME
jgi:DNA repair exonuclease SbcCD ATPase subunit